MSKPNKVFTKTNCVFQEKICNNRRIKKEWLDISRVFVYNVDNDEKRKGISDNDKNRTPGKKLRPELRCR